VDVDQIWDRSIIMKSDDEFMTDPWCAISSPDLELDDSTRADSERARSRTAKDSVSTPCVRLGPGPVVVGAQQIDQLLFDSTSRTLEQLICWRTNRTITMSG
jgi:hypothetical protein